MIKMKRDNAMENKCPKCGCELPKDSAFCLHCFSGVKEEFPTVANNSRERHKAVALIILALIIVGCGLLLLYLQKSPSNNSPSTTTMQITEATEQELASSSVTIITTEERTEKVTTTAPHTTTDSVTTETQATVKQTTTEEQTDSTTNHTTTQKTTQKSTQQENESIVIKDGKLISYPKNKKDSSYTIPYSVTSIKKDAFGGNPYIKKLKFSKREEITCDWANLFSNLPNLETIYICAGTSVDIEGMQYFGGEIIYYD